MARANRRSLATGRCRGRPVETSGGEGCAESGWPAVRPRLNFQFAFFNFQFSMSGAHKRKMSELQIEKCKLRNVNYFRRCFALRRSATASLSFALAILFAVSFSITATSQTRRVVVIKVDGLPYELDERFANERDPLTGKSLLPWIDHVFFQNGTRITNFYVRGMSLSAPSWSLIDTGQHLQIKGNVEFDRDR